MNKRTFRWQWRSFFQGRTVWQSLLVSWLFWAGASLTFAEDFALSAEARAAKGAPHPLPERLYRRLSRMQTMYEQQAYRELYAQLNALVRDYEHDAYVVALGVKLAAYGYLQEGRYAQALPWFEFLRKRPVLEDVDRLRLAHDEAQAHILAERYASGVILLQGWMKQNPKGIAASDYYLLAYAQAQQDNWKAVLAALQTSLKRGLVETDEARDLRLSAYLQLKDYQSARKLLSVLLKEKPQSDRYWQQLLWVFEAQNTEVDILATMRLMYVQQLLPNTELYAYAQRLLLSGNALEAAQLLEQNQDASWFRREPQARALLAQAWELAGEQSAAIPHLYQLLQAEGVDPRQVLRLGTLLAQQERWAECADVLGKYVQRNRADFYPHRFQRALALYELNDLPLAQRELSDLLTELPEDASLFESVSRWQRYLQERLTAANTGVTKITIPHKN